VKSINNSNPSEL